MRTGYGQQMLLNACVRTAKIDVLAVALSDRPAGVHLLVETVSKGQVLRGRK